MKTKMNVWVALLSGASIFLLFLLLHENTGRIAAETKLGDYQLKMDSLKNESTDVANDLRGDLNELQYQLQEAARQHEAFQAEKAAEIDGLNTQMAEAAAAHAQTIEQKNVEMTDLETASKSEAQKFEALLKEKNAEIASLGKQLEEASKNYSELLKKKESVETKNIELEKSLSALEKEIKSIERQKAHLLEVIKLHEETKPEPEAELIKD